MDDLCSALSGSFQVGEAHDCTTSAHPRLSDFKQKQSSDDQPARRERALAAQKAKRKAKVDELRNLDSHELEEEEEEMEVGRSARPHYRRPYKDLIMGNEWMNVVPDDLEVNWLFFTCPVGKRSLVVAKSGKTMQFSRGGALRNTFHSLLPAGSRNTNKRGFTLLDTIYVEATNSYYCFDVLVWNRLDLRDMDTECRNSFITSRLQEIEGGIDQKSKRNPCPIHPVQLTVCSRDNLRKSLGQSYPFEIDGVMFFHKQALYTKGVSPLGCWLKPPMVENMILSEPRDEEMTSSDSSETPADGDMEDSMPQAIER